jgi:hypothetical protein
MTEEKEHYLLNDTVIEERERVFEVVRKLGPKLSGLMLVCGVLVLAFGVYALIVPPDPVLSPRLFFIFAGSLGFVGILNVLCGLLLLLGED